jgi:hypothetical protein
MNINPCIRAILSAIPDITDAAAQHICEYAFDVKSILERIIAKLYEINYVVGYTSGWINLRKSRYCISAFTRDTCTIGSEHVTTEMIADKLNSGEPWQPGISRDCVIDDLWNVICAYETRTRELIEIRDATPLVLMEYGSFSPYFKDANKPRGKK